jgi:rhodanese-related sulfurtransferase
VTHPPKANQIEAHAAYAAVNARTHALLDVRDDDEWNEGHAPGAVHMPVNQLDTSTLDAARPVITVCRSGGRSAKAASVLAAHGFTVSDLTGGMQQWETAGLPVVRPDGSLGRIA